MAVSYTPGQLRDAVGIGQETYRHWKKALAPLRREAGHSPCFTAGDLLATVIVKILVDNGMRVSALSALADKVFEECNARSWPALERSLLLLDVVGARAVTQPEGSALTLSGPTMTVPLRTPIERLRCALLAGGSDGQEELRFPPVAQRSDPLRRKGGSA